MDRIVRRQHSRFCAGNGELSYSIEHQCYERADGTRFSANDFKRLARDAATRLGEDRATRHLIPGWAERNASAGADRAGADRGANAAAGPGAVGDRAGADADAGVAGSADGARNDEQRPTGAVESGSPFGSGTLKRAVLLGSLVRAERGEGRRRVLAGIGEQLRRQVLDRNLRGTFYRRAEPGTTTPRIDDETFTEAFVRLVQDKFFRIKKVQEAVAAAGGRATDVYLAEELSYGRIEERIRHFERDHVRPLIAAMKLATVSREELDHFLYVRHARERNAYIASINPYMPDGSSGMTDAEVTAKAAVIKATGKVPALTRLAARVDKINAERLRTTTCIGRWAEVQVISYCSAANV